MFSSFIKNKIFYLALSPKKNPKSLLPPSPNRRQNQNPELPFVFVDGQLGLWRSPSPHRLFQIEDVLTQAFVLISPRLCHGQNSPANICKTKSRPPRRYSQLKTLDLQISSLPQVTIVALYIPSSLFSGSISPNLFASHLIRHLTYSTLTYLAKLDSIFWMRIWDSEKWLYLRHSQSYRCCSGSKANKLTYIYCKIVCVDLLELLVCVFFISRRDYKNMLQGFCVKARVVGFVLIKKSIRYLQPW